MNQIRLQKFLSQAGIASRRASEQLMRDGKIAVNGSVVTTPGTKIDPSKDRVTYNGKAVQPIENKTTILLYKPTGYICSTTSAQGKTVMELLSRIEKRLYPVGRLDKESEGLLLLTNCGELANQLMHPRYNQLKVYEVEVSGNLSSATLQKLNQRMLIDGYRIHPAKVTLLKAAQRSRHYNLLQFELKEGRNRQIRKMCEQVNLRVERLIRTQIQTLTIGNLQPGQWRELSADEVQSLTK